MPGGAGPSGRPPAATLRRSAGSIEALELQSLFGGEITYPLRAARAEAAWLAGDLRLAAREIEAGLPAFDERTNPWLIGEFAFWAHKIGVEWDCPRRPAEPYAYYLDGYPEKAAAAWAALGCPYDEAQALADSDDQTQVRRALSIFQSLEAAPAAKLVTERLRAMGARRISRGPRPTTRANPVGLSDREVQVLILLADGLRNAEIAERLVVSTRTVDHHVSASTRQTRRPKPLRGRPKGHPLGAQRSVVRRLQAIDMTARSPSWAGSEHLARQVRSL